MIKEMLIEMLEVNLNKIFSFDFEKELQSEM